MSLLSFLFFFLFLFSAGCDEGTGTKTGNGATFILKAVSSHPAAATAPAGAPFAARAAGTSSALPGEDAQGTLFSIETARTYVRRIELKLPNGTDCDTFEFFPFELPVSCNGDKVIVAGPFVADLVGGETMPILGDLTIPEGLYTEVKVRLDDADPADGVVLPGDPLAGYTFRATGTFEYESIARTFEFSLGFDEDVLFESVDGISVSDTMFDNLALSLDVALWFGALPITQCLDDGDLTFTDNHLVIADGGGGSCDMIEDAIKDAIKGSSEFGEEEEEEEEGED